MGRKWTHEERKGHTRDFYPEKRRLLGIVVGIATLLLLLAGALGYAIKAQADIGLVFILGIALVLSVFCAIFLLDTYFYETW